MFERRSGVLMHISSLPGSFGIGTFGREAYNFVDFLEETKQTYWQILPLTTTSYGDSPYQSFSAIAGNTNFIDFDLLAEEGYLDKESYQSVSFAENPEIIDYARLFKLRRPILEKAVKAFLENASNRQALADFEAKEGDWLLNYADFMGIKEHFGQQAFQDWPDASVRRREEGSLTSYRQQLADQILYHKVTQYFFFTQWRRLKEYANSKAIQIIGDMPLYVAADSVEMWTMPDLFKADEERRPEFVAGVPADDFSDLGQYWGNPIYDWDYHRQTDYAWWVERIKASFELYDVLRIDHFKGLSDYWEIPADGLEDATKGCWRPGPGYDLFAKVEEKLGRLPIIAENLGYIDERAEQLLADTGFPGMKIMEFGFFDTSGESTDLPHHYIHHEVAYIGTHDNEVVNGWYTNLTVEQQEYVDAYTNRKPIEPVSRAMLRLLFSSVSNLAIVAMQDLLDRPGDSRMNIPNTVGANWRWRMNPENLSPETKAFLRTLTELYYRENPEKISNED